jgi:TrpR-related protein YerC/YecD
MKQHRIVSRTQEQQAEASLCEAVLKLRSVNEAQAFFQDLCTPAELQALADRWSVVPLLQQGLPYREIHKLTGVSVTTIGRVARCLATGPGGYQTVSSRLHSSPAAPSPLASDPSYG